MSKEDRDALYDLTGTSRMVSALTRHRCTEGADGRVSVQKIVSELVARFRGTRGYDRLKHELRALRGREWSAFHHLLEVPQGRQQWLSWLCQILKLTSHYSKARFEVFVWNSDAPLPEEVNLSELLGRGVMEARGGPDDLELPIAGPPGRAVEGPPALAKAGANSASAPARAGAPPRLGAHSGCGRGVDDAARPAFLTAGAARAGLRLGAA